MNFKNLMNIIDVIYTSIINRLDFTTYKHHYTFLLKRSPKASLMFSKEEIKQYKKKWKKISSKFTIKDYLLFSRYIGKEINIVPESISHYYIETILNPIKYRSFYEDKNIYDKIFPEKYLPKTFLRCIDGAYYDENYILFNRVDNDLLNEMFCHTDGIIIKPSVNTGSGKGVEMFLYDIDSKEYRYYNDSRIKFNIEYLQKYGKNFIIQKKLSQSSYFSAFNQTSINTLRLLVYKSVNDNDWYVINGALRVGKTGSYLDNAHAGGRIVGIDNNGTLGHFCCNQYGEVFNTVNEIDLENKTYIIPDYEKIKQFAKDICRNIIHHRCISIDIAINSHDEPIMIEYNLSSLGTWAWQYTVKPVFGEFTDEIIDYCAMHKREALKVFSCRN